MGLRAPLYIRRCLGRRRCAIPCALCALAAYGVYSKIVPVPEAVRTEVPPPLNSFALGLCTVVTDGQGDCIVCLPVTGCISEPCALRWISS